MNAPIPVALPAQTPRATSVSSARVGLLGASGYAGLEFARLAAAHPGLVLAALFSREHAGQPAGAMIPGLVAPWAGLTVHHPDELENVRAGESLDTLVSALPHGALAELVARGGSTFPNLTRVIDLSGDHRDGRDGWSYGLPEAFRSRLSGATRVANPGCYPTATLLALLPALEAGRVAGPVTVSALSGTSGAGRGPALRNSFAELAGGAAFYRVGEVHPHVAEMVRTIGSIGGRRRTVAFAPQLAPMTRGILATVSAPLDRPATPDEIRALYRSRFAAEPFVRLLPDGDWPETRAVRGSNRCDVAVTTVHDGTTLLATTAIDNLVKGAAGQALQNLNLMLGWPETTALPRDGHPW